MVESEQASVVFEFRGNATAMADFITDRLDQGTGFVLHEQLMVAGETDKGRLRCSGPLQPQTNLSAPSR